MKIDKSEKNIFNRGKFKKVEKILKEEFERSDLPQGQGSCYIYWLRKKQLLKSMFNINWQSPAELNPHIRFD